MADILKRMRGRIMTIDRIPI